MESETDRIRCIGDDGTPLMVVEYRHSGLSRTPAGTRVLVGARRFALSTGEAVRYIDADTFEVTTSGELLQRV